MNRNSFFDKWMSLSRGQRRATIVLVAVIVVLSGIQVGVHIYEQNRQEVTTDYSVIEKEIEVFRSHLDTLPAKQRGKYIRHKKVVRDSTQNNTVPKDKNVDAQQREQQPAVRPVPRIKK